MASRSSHPLYGAPDHRPDHDDRPTGPPPEPTGACSDVNDVPTVKILLSDSPLAINIPPASSSPCPPSASAPGRLPLRSTPPPRMRASIEPPGVASGRRRPSTHRFDAPIPRSEIRTEPGPQAVVVDELDIPTVRIELPKVSGELSVHESGPSEMSAPAAPPAPSHQPPTTCGELIATSPRTIEPRSHPIMTRSPAIVRHQSTSPTPPPLAESSQSMGFVNLTTGPHRLSQTEVTSPNVILPKPPYPVERPPYLYWIVTAITLSLAFGGLMLLIKLAT